MKPEGALFIYNLLVQGGFYDSTKSFFCCCFPYTQHRGTVQLLNLGRFI